MFFGIFVVFEGDLDDWDFVFGVPGHKGDKNTVIITSFIGGFDVDACLGQSILDMFSDFRGARHGVAEVIVLLGEVVIVVEQARIVVVDHGPVIVLPFS